MQAITWFALRLQENAGNDPTTQIVPSKSGVGWQKPEPEQATETERAASLVASSNWASPQVQQQLAGPPEPGPVPANPPRARGLNPAEYPSLSAAAYAAQQQQQQAAKQPGFASGSVQVSDVGAGAQLICISKVEVQAERPASISLWCLQQALQCFDTVCVTAAGQRQLGRGRAAGAHPAIGKARTRGRLVRSLATGTHVTGGGWSAPAAGIHIGVQAGCNAHRVSCRA